jgi:hypothetical protein
MPLHHRHGYAAGFHRGLPTGDITQPRSSPPRPNGSSWVRSAIRPASARFWVGVFRLRGVQPLVPHVCLSVSLAEPAPSGSSGTTRRCRGLLHQPPSRQGRRSSSSFQTPAATGIPRCPSTTAGFANASWRSKSATHKQSGASGANCRPTRSAGRFAAGSAIVVNDGGGLAAETPADHHTRRTQTRDLIELTMSHDPASPAIA